MRSTTFGAAVCVLSQTAAANAQEILFSLARRSRMSGNSPGGRICEGAILQCALMKVLLRLIVVGTLITLAGCGGGGPNPVTPSALTVADVAPSLGQTINSTFAAAMKAGMGIASLQTAQPETVFASLFRLLISQPVYAQGGFVANCPRGGNVRVEYLGAAPGGGRIELSSTPVTYSSCA